MLSNLRQEFVSFALQAGVLMFGEFTTKAGRRSPYFFNAGLFNEGDALGKVAQFYAKTLLAAEHDGKLEFDMLFGPAYKGITLASATAVALSQLGRNVAFAYNRKEPKDHGEGGSIVGGPLAGRVVIVDDVISAGTSVRESVALIRAAGATPAAVLIALDRMERGGNAETIGACSAVEEVERDFGIPVIAIASLTDILDYLQGASDLSPHAEAVARYRARYGVAHAS